MRNGGRVTVTLNTQLLRPSPAIDVDPTTVRLKVKRPNGDETEIVPAWPNGASPIQHDSTGDWHYDTDPAVVPLDQGGMYEFVWKPDGGYPEATVSVYVEPSAW
jgi:hypothetical protein